MRSAFLISIVIITLSSCGKFIEPSYGPTKDVGFENISASGLTINASLYIENKNKYGFRVKTKNMFVYADGKKVATVNLKNKVKIKKDCGQDYKFKIDINVIKGVSLISLGTKSMLTNSPINIELKGKVKGQKFIFGKSVPVEFAKKFNPKQLMNQNGGSFGF